MLNLITKLINFIAGSKLTIANVEVVLNAVKSDADVACAFCRRSTRPTAWPTSCRSSRPPLRATPSLFHELRNSRR